MKEPIRATYRIQVRPEFTLADAAGIIPYLDQLGISHLYSSPFLQAAPGSTHGYDVIDYNQINRELGGQPAFDRLERALANSDGRRMGLVMDMVPNHMAINPGNPWWWDVLKNGPSSRYAGYFDVEWNPPEARHENAVLVPVLGDQYGRVLEAGEVQLTFAGGEFEVHYYDNVYPVDPASLGGILSATVERVPEPARDRLAFLAGAYDRLPDAEATDLASARRRYRDSEVLREMLARLVRERPAVGRAIREVVDAVNHDPDALDAFLRRQNYRLALWKISAGELGYRRFFDINTMIGLRMETEEVFQDTHALVLDLLGKGMLDGLRIDHVDGLLDPGEYLQRLRTAAAQHNREDAWIVVEKILEPGERLPEWPVQGTTGYDFLNRVNGIFVDPRAEAPLTDFYQRFTGRPVDYRALVREKKLLAATQLLGSDLARLTELFLQVCERHRSYRDYTRAELRDALAETAACLPVYRTYITDPNASQLGANAVGSVSGAEAAEVEASQMKPSIRYLDEAIEAAKANRPDLDPRLFDFLRDALLLKERGPVISELSARFQQFTGPVMAKGVEDTTFYIFNRFVSLNEVGGDPGRFGVSLEEFHQANHEAQVRWPLAMLATSTHDTKRSEDVRARLDVISEVRGEWIDAVQRWAEMNEDHRVEHAQQTGREIPGDDGKWPDRNAEYLLYQTLVGAWPISADRVVEYMRKAGREAKEYTTWTAPNAAYEEAVETFARAILKDSRFTADMETFVAQVLDPGRINSLAQTLLKLTAPGIPDIYQGTEVWNLSLVDPDNRRPVDYARRRRMLEGLYDDTAPDRIMEHMNDGLPKLWVMRQALGLRRAHADWFGPGARYIPLTARRVTAKDLPVVDNRVEEELESEEELGETEDLLVAVTGPGQAEHHSVEQDEPVVAYLRSTDESAPEESAKVAVVTPRLVVRYQPSWGEYAIDLPEGHWHNALTHEVVEGGEITLADLFARFPVALLVREEEG